MIYWTNWFQPIESPTKIGSSWFFNETKTIFDLKILLYWSHLNVLSPLNIARWYARVEFWKKIISNWSCSNNVFLCMSWWFIKLLLDTKYLPPKSHYMACYQVFSMKIFHRTGHIYMTSPHCVFSDDLQIKILSLYQWNTLSSINRWHIILLLSDHIYIAFHYCVLSADIQNQIFEANFYHTSHL